MLPTYRLRKKQFRIRFFQEGEGAEKTIANPVVLREEGYVFLVFFKMTDISYKRGCFV